VVGVSALPGLAFGKQAIRAALLVGQIAPAVGGVGDDPGRAFGQLVASDAEVFSEHVGLANDRACGAGLRTMYQCAPCRTAIRSAAPVAILLSLPC
jgi:hypothetical protein